MTIGRLGAALALLVAAAVGWVNGSVAPHHLEDDIVAYVSLAKALARLAPDLVSEFGDNGPTPVADPLAIEPTLDWLEIGRRGRALADHLDRHHRGSRSTRAAYLMRQSRALAAQADAARGNSSSLPRELVAQFGIALPPRVTNAPDVARVRAELEALLPGAAPLAERIGAFDAQVVVPPDLVPVVMARALAECRHHTIAHMDLPARESVTTEYVRGRPWSGFSRYDGRLHSTLQVNLAFPLSVDRLLNLACHEGYPGHHVLNVIRDAQRVDESRQELSVLLERSPEAFAVESIASVATAMAFPADERVAFERDVLFPLAGLDPALADTTVRVALLLERIEGEIASITLQRLDGTLSSPEATRALQERALMVHPQATLRFIEHTRGFALSYTLGKRLVADHLPREPLPATDARANEARWTAYAALARALETPGVRAP